MNDEKIEKLLSLIRHQLAAYAYECGREKRGESFHQEDQRRQRVVVENLVEALNIFVDGKEYRFAQDLPAGWVAVFVLDGTSIDTVLRLDI